MLVTLLLPRIVSPTRVDLDTLQTFFQGKQSCTLADKHDVPGFFHNAPGSGDGMAHTFNGGHTAGFVTGAVHDAGVELHHAGGVGGSRKANGMVGGIRLGYPY